MKRALVLSGGGSLGAYEMGAWKALRELNIDFQVVTGTSIGALNGFFVATNQFELALKLWQNVSIEKVINNAIDLDYNEIQKSVTRDNGKQLKSIIKSYLKNHQLDVSPFYDLVNKYIDGSLITESAIRLGTVSVIWPNLKQVNTIINNQPSDKVQDYLIASSALFPAFPMRTIDGKKHVDGGYRENLPIEFAIDLGANEIIAIDVFGGRSIFNNPLNQLPIVKTIGPSWNLGSILLFKQDVIDKNMALGYNDTMKAFGKKRGFKFTLHDDEKIEEYGRIYVRKLVTTNPHLSKRIFDFLSHDQGWSKRPGDSLLRVLEIVAEAVNVSPEPIYLLAEFIKAIDEHIVVSDKIQKEYKNSSAFQKRFGFFPPTRQEIYQIIHLANQKRINLAKMIKKNKDDVPFVTFAVAAQVVHDLFNNED
ncbi:MAG: patatin-like phospholipase family protein [Bacilli bacterium]